MLGNHVAGQRPLPLLLRYGAELGRILDRGQAGLALARGQELQKLDRLMRSIVQQSFDGILSIDHAGRITTANEAALRIFGARRDQLIGRHASHLFPAMQDYRRVQALPGEPAAGRLEGTARRADSSEFPVELAIRPTLVDGQPLLIAIVRDITEAKAQEARLRHQALHDSLTGLPNRALLADRLRQALRAAARDRQPLALLLLDLDRFKELNDTLGHHVGDLLLRHLAERLSICLRQSDTIARLGGDEFAILLPAASDMDRAWSISRRIIEAVEEPFEVIAGLRLEVGLSIGIALFPEHAQSASKLMQCADVAMYAAKRSPSAIQTYDRRKDHNSVRHLTLSGALREAIEGNQLYFDYQPKLDLIAGTIASVEALARWRHPTQGLIPPGEFVAQAEQTGLIQPLTHWTFNSAFAQLAAWRRDGLAISVSINLSSRSLHDDKLPRTVADLLEEWQVDPAGITLELTESAVMLDPAGAQRNLFRLYDLGLRLSIDDFGTGYSSLSHLQRLPLDELKIDRSFVAQMDTNQQDLVIVRSTIDLARNLGLRVVAEGIESARHIALLRRLGCQLGQGFFIAEPLSIELLTRWLGELRWAPGAAEEKTAVTLAEETL